MPASTDTPTASPIKPPASLLKRALVTLVALIVLGALGVVGWRIYGEYRHRRIVDHARELLDKGDHRQAMMAVHWALQVDPRDLTANRMMAELADISGSTQAVFWHREIAELEPGVVENHVKWAEAALRLNNVAQAEQALAGMPEAARKTAAFHELAARLAQAQNQPASAETHFAAAVQLAPDNQKYAFGLATARLDSSDAAVHDEAHAAIERLKNEPEFRRRAHRVLIQDAFRRKQWKEGFLLAADLQGIPGAPFEDRLLLLDLLRKFKRPELHAFLLDVEEQAAANPEHVAALINWLNRNTMALIAADWSKRLPEEMRKREPVPAAIAESYANLHDWERLKPLVAEGKWEYFDYMRLALLARVHREQGDTVAARNQWNAAVKAAADRPEWLERLAEFAGACKWENESLDLLWQVARGKTNQGWAFTGLQRAYVEKANTRGLLNVATRMLEVNPKDLVAQNNVAALSLLLNTNMDRAQILARDAYAKDAGNPGVAATYAYALHLLGKTDEGLKIMQGIEPRLLETPAFAVYYGVLLADGGAPAEAAKYLQLAGKGRLLREEMDLAAKASARLARAGAEGAPGAKR